MDSERERGKVFIGGISWETSEERLREYFGNYGQILEAVVMRDKISGRPRGFGFVVFSDPSVLDSPLLLHNQHSIDGRTVEAKRALSREEQHVSKANSSSSSSATPNYNNNNNIRTKKIFVGGLPPTLTEQGFRHYFQAYGHVTDVVVMYDQQTNRPRGFGFISFDSEDAVDRVLHTTFHDLDGKQVEVKRALPKDANPPAPPRSMPGPPNYQAYAASGGGSYDSNRYMQSQNAPAAGGGGYPPYASSPGYAYAPGPTNAYATYGAAAGNPAYAIGGPPAAPYGNPNIPTAAYGSGPSAAPRTSWNAQPSSGYAGAYGNAPWGAAGNGGPQATPPTGQSPSGAAGYGNQGYGYGGGDGSYGNPAGYGAVGARIGGAPNTNSSSGVGPGGDMQSAGGGYMGSGYGDANGNSGYGNSGWRADPSQASGNYGAQGNGGYGGYGGVPARQG